MGKAVIEIVQILQSLQSRTCPYGETCDLPRIDLRERKVISNFNVYEALQIPSESQLVRYSVMMKVDNESSVEVASYRIDPIKFTSTPDMDVPKISQYCANKHSKKCQKCVNFQKRTKTQIPGNPEQEKSTLKYQSWVAIYLTISSCGTIACIAILAFVSYRFYIEKVLDGNPTLTLILIIATMFMLQAVVPFCLEEEVLGAEHLSACKIFVATLSIGVTFSIMLTRAIFLSFSSGGVFSMHINGYLQGLMLFFMAGVQIAISTMYFVLGSDQSIGIIRSLTFIALLGKPHLIL